MRIALIDRPNPEDRPAGFNRFADVADLLRHGGHDVLLLNGAPVAPAGSTPILTGLNRAVAAAPMIEAHALAHHLATQPPDLVIAPLRGGIAQGVLMARACGEAFERTRVALWSDTPSSARFLREEDLPSGLAPLVADALERQAIMLADAVIVPSAAGLPLPFGLDRRDVPTFRADLPIPPRLEPSPAPRQAPPIEEIVFGGPLRRHAGVVDFIAAIERLAAEGLLADRSVTFLGPARTGFLGIGKEWLGFRAANWAFPFRIIDAVDPAERLRYIGGAGRLAVAVGNDPEELLPLRRSGGHHVALLRGSDNAMSLADRLEVALREALAGTPANSAPETQPTDWAKLAGDITALPSPAIAAPAAVDAGVTVCVLHRNRLNYLAEALASIPNRIGGYPVELLVLDNGSDIAIVEEEIRRLAGPREMLRVVAIARPVPQAQAYNRGASEARHQTIVFLDDDNCFADTGVERMARAIAVGGLDIAVTALDIFDDGAGKAAPAAGRLIFLGAAHSTGLFFNAFGDTAMAVRRDSFLALGGFHDPGFSYSHLDWVTLAKAQAAGLRIGALQWPAVRYRRNITRADLEANKIDQEGARAFVFEAYGEAFDAKLVARYAQKLQLDEL